MGPRSRAFLVGLAALAVASCSGGGGSREVPTTTSAKPGATPSPASSTTLGTVPVTPSGATPPAGSVAFRVLGAPLAEAGLRVLMDPSEGTVQVVVRGLPGGSDGVEVCPVRGIGGVPMAASCVVARSGEAVDLAVGEGADGGPAGVLLRPRTGSSTTAATVPEVTFTYRPGGDQVTVVTPPLPPSETPGDCPGGPCEMTFDVTPSGRGTFALDADGRGGRPQLTLRSGTDGAGSSRVVSMVEGGASLRIRSTVDGPTAVSLTLRNLGAADLPPLELALVWPTPR